MTTDAPARLKRDDGFPDGMSFRDTGCHLHKSCLACPRAVCVHDEQSPGHSVGVIARTDSRKAEVLRLTAEGLNAPAIAARMGITKRTVYRLRALK